MMKRLREAVWPGGSDTVGGALFRGVSADAPDCLQWQRENEAGVGVREEGKQNAEERKRQLMPLKVPHRTKLTRLLHPSFHARF